MDETATECGEQCDQIGRFVAFLASIQSRWQQLLGNFCKGVKSIHYSSEIIFGQLL